MDAPAHLDTKTTSRGETLLYQVEEGLQNAHVSLHHTAWDDLEVFQRTHTKFHQGHMYLVNDLDTGRIAEALTGSTRTLSLRIQNQRLGDAGARALAAALPHTQLIDFDISGNYRIGVKGYAALQAAALKSKTLLHFNTHSLVHADISKNAPKVDAHLEDNHRIALDFANRIKNTEAFSVSDRKAISQRFSAIAHVWEKELNLPPQNFAQWLETLNIHPVSSTPPAAKKSKQEVLAQVGAKDTGKDGAPVIGK